MTAATAAVIAEIAAGFGRCHTDRDRDRIAAAIQACLDEDRPTEPTGDQPWA